MLDTELTFTDDKGKSYKKKCRSRVASLKVMRDVRLLDAEYTDRIKAIDTDGVLSKTNDDMSKMTYTQQLDYTKVASGLQDITQEKVLALAKVLIDTATWKDNEIEQFNEGITDDFWMTQNLVELTDFVNSFRSTVERTIPTN